MTMSEKVERQALGDMSNDAAHPAQEGSAQTGTHQNGTAYPVQEKPAQIGKQQNGAAQEGSAQNDAQQNDTQQNGTQQNGDAKKQHPGQLKAAKEKLTSKQQKLRDKNNPPGGYDATPVPTARDGYTVRFTFHRAENLPASDLNTRSSDPFIIASLTSSLLKRHKDDPDLVLRTQTIHENTNPEWNKTWTVAGIPGSGFRLKCRLYDEDPADHDDRLGNVTIYVESLGPNWQGFREKAFDVKKRMGSKRAYGVRACAAMFDNNVHMDGTLYLSAECLGPSEKPYGRMYTIGETYFFKHYSPMIGRLAGTKAPGSSSDGKPPTEKYDFQANQIQLQGPVPAELYHRFVEFKPFVKGMFSGAGLRGRVLNKALHHQHARVYNFSNSTEYGVFPTKSQEASLQFLKMVHFDEGGRIFTYVLSLDGLLRFTETGKEFGVDLLSKHTMHSDVNIYIACSGEFFVRRLKHPHRSIDDPSQSSHPIEEFPGGPPFEAPPKDPSHYELVIDNDSGTYRPNGSLLPLLKKFLNENFPGLHIVTKECTDEHLQKMKQGQRERKKKEGKEINMVQNSDDDISSSDEDDLNDLTNSGRRGKSKRERIVAGLEDPSQALKDMKKEFIPGRERVEREENEDIPEVA